jgi:hypothetical protein
MKRIDPLFQACLHSVDDSLSVRPCNPNLRSTIDACQSPSEASGYLGEFLQLDRIELTVAVSGVNAVDSCRDESIDISPEYRLVETT